MTQPLPVLRLGSYHDAAADAENPSATALRNLLENGLHWHDFVPQEALACFENAPIHTHKQCQQAILYRLRTMTDADFEALPYGSEGLWRKLMHASRKCASLEEISAATKSKRYTRTRIDRMILCAFLGLTAQDLATAAPYCRVLAFNDTGRTLLKQVKESGYFVNIGTDTRHPYQEIEHRATSLYGLFAEPPEAPDTEDSYRIYYQKA